MKKKCPYATNRHVDQQTVYEYNEYGAVTFQHVVEQEVVEFTPCCEDECGSWKNGQCSFYSDSNCE